MCDCYAVVFVEASISSLPDLIRFYPELMGDSPHSPLFHYQSCLKWPDETNAIVSWTLRPVVAASRCHWKAVRTR
jgi:hypothetical protein